MKFTDDPPPQNRGDELDMCVTSPDPCQNCGGNNNITVRRTIPWLDEHESRFVCEFCLRDHDEPLFGLIRSAGVHWSGAER